MTTHPIVSDYLKSLIGTTDFVFQSEQIERWAVEERGDLLFEIAIALEEDGVTLGIPEISIYYILNKILYNLALSPSPGFAKLVSRLAVMPPGKQIWKPRNWTMRYRTIAEQLATSADRETLVVLFEEQGENAEYREYLACLLQEMVLRGKADGNNRVLVRFQESLKRDGHPLSKLPLHLLDMEKQFPMYLPYYRLRGSSVGIPFTPSVNADASPNVSAPAVNDPSHDNQPTNSESLFSRPRPTVSRKEDSQPSTALRISAAVLNWAEASNGRYEARELAVSPPLSKEQVTAELLYTSHLDCLAEAIESDISLRPVPPCKVLSQLFSAAAGGGAINHGRCGAYGRREAWESIAGLSDCGSDDAEEIKGCVQECRGWWRLEAGKTWFNRVAWDTLMNIGIVALRSNGETLAVLAATDTD